MCDEKFRRNCDLELHIKSFHKVPKSFEWCDKTFVLSWQLKKHQELHTNKMIRFCHYFNNKKECPFEELGCMFLHQNSELCKYDQVCSKQLCSYKHSKSNSKEKETDQTSEEEKVYKFECEYCDFKSDCHNFVPGSYKQQPSRKQRWRCLTRWWPWILNSMLSHFLWPMWS